MGYTLKPKLLDRIAPLVEQGLSGGEIAETLGIGKREAQWYAQQIRAGRTSPNGSGPDSTPPAPEPVMVPLEQIDQGHDTQARERMNRLVIQDYAEAMQEGAVFPPIVLFVDDGGYWI